MFFRFLIAFLFISSAYSQSEVGFISTKEDGQIPFYELTDTFYKEQEKKQEELKEGRFMILVNEPLAFTKNKVRYYKNDDTWGEIELINVDSISYGKRTYKKINGELFQIILETNKYILGNQNMSKVVGGGMNHKFTIITKDGFKKVVDQQLHSKKEKEDLKSLKKLEKYFSDCPSFIELVKKNIRLSGYKRLQGRGGLIRPNYMLRGINNFNCY